MAKKPAEPPPMSPDAPHSESFELLAEVYDLLMRGVPYRTWVSYYLLLLATVGFKPKRLLDVACGTGTMAMMLVEEGFDVAGFDLSKEMIEVARRKAYKKHKPITYWAADARDVDLGETFDSAYSFFDSLNNIVDPLDLERALARVFAHIRPGGCWIFDLNTAYAFEHQMFDQRNLNPQAKLRYDWKGTWDAEAREVTVDMRFWKGEQEFRETHRQRAYEPDEVIEMLRSVGFVDIRAFHSYTLNPPRATSDRIHYACTRP